VESDGGIILLADVHFKIFSSFTFAFKDAKPAQSV
jgi:hypothetical protein